MVRQRFYSAVWEARPFGTKGAVGESAWSLGVWPPGGWRRFFGINAAKGGLPGGNEAGSEWASGLGIGLDSDAVSERLSPQSAGNLLCGLHANFFEAALGIKRGVGSDDEVDGLGAFLPPEPDESGVCGCGFDGENIDSGAKEVSLGKH